MSHQDSPSHAVRVEEVDATRVGGRKSIAESPSSSVAIDALESEACINSGDPGRFSLDRNCRNQADGGEFVRIQMLFGPRSNVAWTSGTCWPTAKLGQLCRNIKEIWTDADPTSGRTRPNLGRVRPVLALISPNNMSCQLGDFVAYRRGDDLRNMYRPTSLTPACRKRRR